MEKLDVLFSQIVNGYTKGEVSKEKALAKLMKKHESTLIDIKKELHEHFEQFAFHKYIKCDIDEYIEICNKIENSPSVQEREDYEELIRIIIDGAKADCDYYGYGQQGDSAIIAIRTVRNEVDKIRALCRENKEKTELYEKYKVEIEDRQALLRIQTESSKEEDYEKNSFIQILKHTSPPTYEAMRKAIGIELVEYNNKYFNFRCSRGSVGLFFGKSGIKQQYMRNMICQFVLINNDPCELITLRNWKKNNPS
jgi:hypothetical protein